MIDDDGAPLGRRSSGRRSHRVSFARRGPNKGSGFEVAYLLSPHAPEGIAAEALAATVARPYRWAALLLTRVLSAYIMLSSAVLSRPEETPAMRASCGPFRTDR